MRIAILRPGKDLEVSEAPDDATERGAHYREILGGWLEMLPAAGLYRFGVAGYLNEDGKGLDLDPNLELPWGDTVVGPIVFVGSDPENRSEDAGLTDAQLAAVMVWLGGHRRVYRVLRG